MRNDRTRGDTGSGSYYRVRKRRRSDILCYLCIYSVRYPAPAGQSTELDPNDGSIICILTMHHQHNPQWWIRFIVGCHLFSQPIQVHLHSDRVPLLLRQKEPEPVEVHVKSRQQGPAVILPHASFSLMLPTTLKSIGIADETCAALCFWAAIIYTSTFLTRITIRMADEIFAALSIYTVITYTRTFLTPSIIVADETLAARVFHGLKITRLILRSTPTHIIGGFQAWAF